MNLLLPPVMTWRGSLTAFLVAFGVVVSSSFGYGVYLLAQLPSSAGREGLRPAPRPPDVAALLERGRAHLEKREVEQALVAYRRALIAGPSASALLGLAEAESRAGRAALAAAEYERVLRLDPANATALRQLARIRSWERATWPAAEKLYRAYLAASPADAEALLGLARLLAWQGRVADAVELYASRQVQALMSAADRRDHALALAAAGRPEQARPLLEGQLAEAPQDRDLALALAGTHASRGDWTVALPIYRGLLERAPDDAQLNLMYGLGLLAGQEHTAAVAHLEKAVAGRPTDGQAALALGRAARGAGKAKLAERQFERAVALRSGDAAAAREFADLLMERRNFRNAEAQYRKAQALGLSDDRLLLGLGGALAANGKPREALPLLERVYARQPSDRLAYDLARLYQSVGENRRALALLDELERSGARRE